MYRIVARLTKTVLTAVDARECTGDISQHDLATPAKLLCHCLRLKCVYARQPPNARLI